MSPEQARGEKLDVRTDVFSFGVVLYEMATGRQPFAGGSGAEAITAILRDRPVPPSQLHPQLPPKFDEIISKALEKDRDLRYHSAGDLRADLKRLKRDTDSGPSAGEMPAPGQTSAPTSDSVITASLIKRHKKIVVAAVVVIALALVALAWSLRRHPPNTSAELSQQRLTFKKSADPVQSQAISPDGKYLAYSDTAGIHVKLLSTGDERLIPRPAGVPAGAWWQVASWFPDGTQLLAQTYEPGGGHESMWVVPVLGQSPRILREGAWAFEVSPDGTRIAFTTFGASGLMHELWSGLIREIWMMGSQGENPHKVLGLAGKEWFNSVHWSPDGQRLGYLRARGVPGGTYGAAIETCDLRGANRTVVVPDAGDAGIGLEDFYWLRDGRIVYSRTESTSSSGENLWQIRIDGRTGMPAGKPERITRWAGSDLGNLCASADGKRLTLTKTVAQAEPDLGELTAGGTHLNPPRRLNNEEDFEFVTAWTEDSKSVFFSSDRNGAFGIFKQGIHDNAVEPVVPGRQGFFLNFPRLSPDGAWILYMEMPETVSTNHMMRMPVGGGVPQLVMEIPKGWNHVCARAPSSLCVVLEETEDEKHLTVTSFDPVKGRGRVLRTIERDPAARGMNQASALSPDGSTFAISRSGEAEIHVRLISLSGGADRDITVKGWPNVSWMGLNWAVDGKGLYCGSSSNQAGTLLYVDLKGNARVLWQFKGGAGVPIWGTPSPDGRYLAIQGFVVNRNVWMLEGF
jgi:Tol biopolymer transport system component